MIKFYFTITKVMRSSALLLTNAWLFLFLITTGLNAHNYPRFDGDGVYKLKDEVFKTSYHQTSVKPTRSFSLFDEYFHAYALSDQTGLNISAASKGDATYSSAISGGVLWLRADKKVNSRGVIPNDNTLLSIWYDLFTNDNHNGGSKHEIQNGMQASFEKGAPNETSFPSLPTFRNNARDNINFNPIMEFSTANNGNAVQMRNPAKGDQTIFSVFSASGPVSVDSQSLLYGGQLPLVNRSGVVNNNRTHFSFGISGGNCLSVHSGADNLSNKRGSIDMLSVPAIGVSTRDVIDAQIANLSLYVNGSEDEKNFPLNRGSGNDLGASVRIGTDYTGGNYFKGKYAELLVYGKVLTESQRHKVESYLAVKYGITLTGRLKELGSEKGNSNYDYLHSHGGVIWKTNPQYKFDVAGIGKDIGEASLYLEQKVSKSVNKFAILTMATSSNFVLPNTDSTRPSINSNRSFFMCANNHGALGFVNLEQDPSVIFRLGREWKVQKTSNFNNAIYLQFDIKDFPSPKLVEFKNLYLAVDNDGDFTSGVTYISATSYTSGKVTFDNPSLADGQYFTIVLKKDVNKAPVADDETERTNEDTDLVIDVKVGDTDSDGTIDPRTVVIITNPRNGTVRVNASTGKVTYSPRANYSGLDSFTYTIKDNDGLVSNTATVSITVIPVNDPPVADDETERTNEDTDLVIDVKVGDTDSDGTIDPRTVVIITNPRNGTVRVNASTGKVTYSPRANYSGPDSFTYTIKDNDGLVSNTATVSITVIPVNDPPVADDETERTNEDTDLVIDVKVGDTDSDGTIDPRTVVIITNPTNGTVRVNASTGKVTYSPRANYSGPDSFTYTIKDNNGLVSNTATVSITVIPVNDPPVADDETERTNEDTDLVIDVKVGDTDSDGTIDPRTVVIITNPTNGTVRVNASTGKVTYSPRANYSGPDSFTYTIKDNNGLVSNTATVSITVIPVNDPPVADDETERTNEDTDLVIDVKVGDTDSDGTIDPRTVVIITNPTNGTVRVNASTGKVTYSPRANYSGPDSFTYTIKDNDGLVSNTATVSITVIPVNDPPVADDETERTNEDTDLVIDVKVGDTDSDGTIDPRTVVIITNPTNGSVRVNASTGKVTYSPRANYSGPDSFTYTIKDNDGLVSNTATVSITVIPVNDPPVADDEIERTNEDTDLVIDVKVGDTDIDGTIDPRTVVIITNPTNGTVRVNASTGKVTYSPRANYSGPDSFTYTIKDNDGLVSNTATVSITVIPVNDPPVADDETERTNEDTDLVIDVKVGDTDSDGTIDPRTVVIITNPTNGTVRVNASTGKVTYSPRANYSGPDSFTYTIKDNDGLVSNVATVSIKVTPVNDAPVAVDDEIVVLEGGTAKRLKTGQAKVQFNDTDTEDRRPGGSVILKRNVTHGTLKLKPNGTFIYIHNGGETVSDSFTYKVKDKGGLWSNVATVSIKVTPVNDPPVANNDVYTVKEDAVYIIRNVITTGKGTDTDVDTPMSRLSVIKYFISGYSKDQPLGAIVKIDKVGTIRIGSDGELKFSPLKNYNGSVPIITYTLSDEALEDTATVTISVADKGNPVAKDDTANTIEDTLVKTGNVLDNDTIIDGATITSSDTSSTKGGTVVNNGDGTFNYTPKTGFVGDDTFTYTICDDDVVASCSTATVTITVTDQGNPVAKDDTANTIEDTLVKTGNVLDNDTIIDGATITSSDTSSTKGGTVVNNGDGTFNYTPKTGFVGDDTFTYTICDDDVVASCSTATVTITVTDQGNPVAKDDTASTIEDTLVKTGNVLDNDTIIDGAIITSSDSSSTKGGTVVNNGDGTFNYTPKTGFVGDDTFTYTICDDDATASCSTATVTITVTDQGNPVAKDDTANTIEDTLVKTGNVLDNDTIIDGAIITSSDTSSTKGGTVVNNGDGTFNYTPKTGFVGDDTFTYTICDDDVVASCSTATVTITVTDQGNPVAKDDTANTIEDTLVKTGNVLDNDTIIDGATITSSDTSSTKGGTVVNNGDGTFNYTPKTGFVGDDTFTYTICDDDVVASCSTATVTITVTDQGNPVAKDDTANTIEDTLVKTGNVLDNDTIIDGATITSSDTSSTKGGTVVNNGDGTFNYTPKTGFVGDDTFTYTICDDDVVASCSTATVTITVTDQGNPVAKDDTANTIEDTLVKTGNVLDNDTIIDGAIITSSDISSIQGGTVVNNGDGTFNYTPKTGFVGDDTFTYTICDDDVVASCSTATVTITVTDQGNPVAKDDTANTIEDTLVKTGNVLDNDTIIDGATITSSDTSSTKGGTVVNNGDGTFNYTPKTGFVGDDTFTYTICDDDVVASCSTATVTITVTDQGNPVAKDDTANTIEDTLVKTGNVLDNDTIIDGATITSSDTSSTKGGTVVNNGDGTFNYTPKTGFVGDDTFTYTICDDDVVASCSTATVTITVTDQGNPVAKDDTASTIEDTLVKTGNVLDNDTIIDGAIITSSDSSSTKGGTVVNNGDGTFNYTPKTGFVGDDTFTYTICDDDATASCSTATVTITVTDQGNPVAKDDTANTIEDTLVKTGNVLDNDTIIDGAIITSSDTSSTKGGTVVNNGDGTFNYTPKTGFVGDDTFTYTICDDDVVASCSTATVTITVTDQGDPVAKDDTANTIEDTLVKTGNVLDNDTIIDGAIITSSDTSSTQGGRVVNNGDGTFNYTPKTGFVGDDTFTYTICDDDATASCSTATVTITVTDQGNPVAKDDTANTIEDTLVKTGNVLDNDTIIDGAIITSSDISSTQGGRVVNNGDGTFNYTPKTGFVGDDTFTYTICDDDVVASCSTATVTITVTDQGNPVAKDDTASTIEDTLVKTGNVLDNDTIIDGAIITSSDISSIQGGTVVNNGDGTFNYTPKTGFVGDDTFTYTICDDDATASCSTATVTITVTDQGNPVAKDDTASTIEDTLVKTGNVLDNDTIIDGAIITSSDISSTKGGTVVDNGDGTFNYTPKTGFVGDDTFTYTLCDDDATASCSTAAVTITVTDQGNPVAKDDTASTAEDVLVKTGNVLTNDMVIDGAKITRSDTSSTEGGTVVNNGDGTFNYTPKTGFVGDDTFTYILCDDDATASCSTATVTITVTDQGNPVAKDDTASTAEDVLVKTGNVLTNDMVIDGAKITRSDTSSTEGGTVVNNGDGTFNYVPKTGFVGEDTFTYTICDDDATASCSTATVTITVNTFELIDDFSRLKEDGVLITSVLSNDKDLYSMMDKTSLEIFKKPTNGIVSVDVKTGKVTYTPNADYSGEDSYEYKVCSVGTPKVCKTATVSIHVIDKIDTVTDLVTTKEDNAVTFKVLTNDVFAGNVTVTKISEPENGTVKFSSDGTVDYTPTTNFNGEETLFYTVTIVNIDGTTKEETGTITIKVLPVNDPPVAVDDVQVVKDGESEVVIHVLDNDYDLDGDTIFLEGATSPANGAVVLNDDGTVTYIPNPEFLGVDSFEYEICDGSGDCVVGSVSITVEIKDIVTPNAFSPNDDGHNDSFVIKGLGEKYPNFSMEIFNRWGNMVYTYTHNGNPDQRPSWWDGKSSGRLTFDSGKSLPTGTYFYIIRFNDHKKSPFQGWVYLIK